ncbi:MAG: acyl-CoA dehydrogenase family protein, partial [Candidatus Binatia bacterium]
MLPFFDEDHAALRERVRMWAERKLFAPPRPQKTVDQRALQLARDLGADGFFKYTAPHEFGGIRYTVQARDLCILREELARGDALADTMCAMQALGSYPIALAGSESQKRKYLPRVARGKAVAAFAITEAEAGSDVASMRTRAVRQGSEFSITGTKCFISNAGIAAFYVVFASTEPDKKAKGISAFVVDSAARGLTVKGKTELLSPHPIGVIEFENCVVGAQALLGKVGEGLQIAFATLDLLRCTVGAAAIGLAQRALEEAIQYS